MSRASSGASVSSERQNRTEFAALRQLLEVVDHELRNKDELIHGEHDDDADTVRSRRLAGLIHAHVAVRVGSATESQQIDVCDGLAESLWSRCLGKRDWLALQACIEVTTQLVDLAPPVHPKRAHYCQALAISLYTRFRQTQDAVLLDEAIPLFREALALRPEGHALRRFSCDLLASSLWARFEHVADNAPLDEAIQLGREALALRPASLPGHDASYDTLATWLLARFKQTGDSVLLSEAVSLEGEALKLRPSGHPERADSCHNLARMLWTQFEQTGDGALLDRSIELDREVIALQPDGHPERHITCGQLALSLCTAFQRTGDVRLLDESAQLFQEALAAQPAGYPGRANLCSNLSILLWTRFQRTGDTALLGEATDVCKEALALRPSGHPDRYSPCNNLAMLLWTSFQHTGDTTLLDEAIQLYREALTLQSARQPGRFYLCNNLALSLRTRYAQTGDAVLIEEAIRLYREALALVSVGHAERQNAYNNLALTLQTQFERTGDDTALDEAIQLHREVLDLQPVGSPNRDVACNNLATGISMRPSRPSDCGDHDEAVQLHREALALRPAGHPLRHQSCTSLAQRLQSVTQSHLAHEEISGLLDEALVLTTPDHPDRWLIFCEHAHLALVQSDHAAAVSYFHSMLSAPISNVPDLAMHACSLVNHIDPATVPQSEQLILLKSYAKVLDLVNLSTGFALDRSSQLDRAIRNVDVGPRAFMLASRVHDLPFGMQLLEHARGVIWSQTLRVRDPQLDHVPNHLAKKLQDVLRSMNSPAQYTEHPAASLGLFLPERDLLHQQRSQLQHILSDIRSHPGLEDFMHGPNSHQLLAAAAHHPVALLLAAEDDCHALIIKSPGEPLVDIALGIDKKAIQNLTLAMSTPQQRSCDDAYDADRAIVVSTKTSTAHATLAKLWRAVVKPVIVHLRLVRQSGRSRSRIYWCPTGPFAFTPVHAAGIYEGRSQECCADYVVSSYAPTLTSLLRAQKQAKVHNTRQSHMVAVAVEQAHNPALQPLRWVTRESARIVELATNAGVIAHSLPTTMTTSEVIASFQSANFVHLACHGIQNHAAPHESHFCLGSGDLTVSDLMQVDLSNAFFAFLSACETAKGAEKHADEVVHLAATMLFAGFQSVVATMWAMNDRDGPYLTEIFYQKLFATETVDVDSIAYTLDEAVTTLRESGVPPERWATFVHMGA